MPVPRRHPDGHEAGPLYDGGTNRGPVAALVLVELFSSTDCCSAEGLQGLCPSLMYSGETIILHQAKTVHTHYTIHLQETSQQDDEYEEVHVHMRMCSGVICKQVCVQVIAHFI